LLLMRLRGNDGLNWRCAHQGGVIDRNVVALTVTEPVTTVATGAGGNLVPAVAQIAGVVTGCRGWCGKLYWSGGALNVLRGRKRGRPDCYSEPVTTVVAGAENHQSLKQKPSPVQEWSPFVAEGVAGNCGCWNIAE
jgi:hypothetical protein